MPRLTKALPKYRKHRASGQAIVTLDGRDFYLGPHGTSVSKMEYDRLVAEWLANGRRLPSSETNEPSTDWTIVELLAGYKRFAQGYYVKNGRITNEVNAIKSMLRLVRRLYAREKADNFSPKKLKAVRELMIQEGWSRKHINKQVKRVVRMFRWGVEEEKVTSNVVHALAAVKGLRKGKTSARETPGILPIGDDIVQKTLPLLTSIVADMVRLQRLTGCRPEEVCIIRPCDVDRTEDIWRYRPQTHKTEAHDRDRVIFLGPRAQSILRPYLLRGTDAYCFSPKESDRQRREMALARRKTPLNCGNRAGTNLKAAPKLSPGDRYTTDSYRRAIHRACESAFGLPEHLRDLWRNQNLSKAEKQLFMQEARAWRAKHCWSPNRLRHAAATEIRKRFGLESAQVILGHSAADVTQIYAERDMNKAAEIMRMLG